MRSNLRKKPTLVSEANIELIEAFDIVVYGRPTQSFDQIEPRLFFCTQTKTA